MINLSYQNKCWIVANSTKVFGLPATLLVLLTIGASTYVKGRSYFDFIGIIGIIVLLVPAFYSIKYAYEIAKFGETNYNEIISRRTRYVKSNTELQEMKYRFMLETFLYAFLGLFAPAYTLVWFIGFVILK